MWLIVSFQSDQSLAQLSNEIAAYAISRAMSISVANWGGFEEEEGDGGGVANQPLSNSVTPEMAACEARRESISTSPNSFLSRHRL